MTKAKISFFLFLLIVPILVTIPLTYAATIGNCNIQGLTSPDNMKLVSLKVTGTESAPKTGQQIMVNFTLENRRSNAVYPINDGSTKSLYFVIEYPGGGRAEIAPSTTPSQYWNYPYPQWLWDPYQKAGFWYPGITLAVTGTWKIWPAYRVNPSDAQGQIVAPDYWGGCQFEVTSLNTSSSPSPQQDIVPPTVEAQWITAPAPGHGSRTSFDRNAIIRATASDEVAVRNISIYVDNQHIGTCTINAVSGECTKNKNVSVGRHEYYAVAYDSSGNYARMVEEFFFVSEDNPPQVFVAASPIDPAEGDLVTFTATASDESGITELAIYLEGEQIGQTCFSKDTCSVTAPIPRARKVGNDYVVEYYARTLDGTARRAITPNQTLYVRDRTPPQILSMATSPQTPDVNDPFNFTVIASDNQDLWQITITANNLSGALIRAWPTCSFRNNCTMSLDVRRPQSINFSVLVTDRSFNSVSGNYILNFRDTPPAITLITHNPIEPTTRDQITMYTTARDDSEVDSIEIYVNNELARRCYPRAREGACAHTIFGPHDGWIFPYYIIATDNSGKTMRSETRWVYFVYNDEDADNDTLPYSMELNSWTDPNDPDTDDDGLLDGWEVLGVRDDRGRMLLDLPGMGAHPLLKDLFLELDWMEDAAHTHKPENDVLQRVINAFAQKNIRLHIDIGQWGGGNSVPHQPGSEWHQFDLNATQQAAYTSSNQYLLDIKRNNFDARRIGAFYWGIFVHEKAGSSGQAEVGGNFYVALNERDQNTWKAGTLMHEFGHTLQLGHGGRVADDLLYDNSNYKPNYRSIMNYHFQLNGIPRLDAAGNVVYDLDYSDEDLPDLNESRLNEVAGLRSPQNNRYLSYYTCTNRSTGPIPSARRVWQQGGGGNALRVMFPLNGSGIDWNCDGRISGNQGVNINGAGKSEWNVAGGTLTVLQGRDDWDSVVLPIGCPGYGIQPLLNQNSVLDVTGLDGSCPELAEIRDSLSGVDTDEEFPPIIPFAGEACDRVDNDEDGLIDEGCPDQDNDTVVDELDNCIAVYNPEQTDSNNDFVGDACAEEYRFKPNAEIRVEQTMWEGWPFVIGGVGAFVGFLVLVVILAIVLSRGKKKRVTNTKLNGKKK